MSCVACASPPVFGSNSASRETAHPLRPGEALEREIRGGEAQTFGVTLEAGHCARLVVERRGIDLLVTVAAPDGSPAVKFENPAGEQSPVFVTVAAGEYTVEVRPVDKWAAAGHYTIRFEAARARGPLDEKRLEAMRRMAEGRRLQLLETRESRRAALVDYEAARALWEEVADDFEAANALHFMGQTYKALGMFDESLRSYEQALARRADDVQATAYTLLDKAAAYRDLRDPFTALPFYESALSIFREKKNRRGESVTLFILGLIYHRKGNTTRALEYYEQALPLHRAEGDRYGEARTLNAMGGVCDMQSKPQEAIAFYEQAIKGWEATGDPAQKGNTLNNLGKLYDDFGQWQKALEHYGLALAGFEKGEAGDSGGRQIASIKRMRAVVLYNIGYTYIVFGDWPKAMDYLRRSLELREDPSGRGITLTQMGYAEVLSGEPLSALDHCRQALTLLESVEDIRRAQTLTVMGMSYDATGEREKALEVYQRALDLQQNPEAPDLQGQARTLTKMGDAYAATGEADKALEYFGRARALWQSFGERDGEALALFGAARVARGRGHTGDALKQTEAALELTEPLRANITNRQLRASYFASKVSYYELYIDLLMRGGSAAQTAAAFTASERARARSLLDLLSDARVETVADADPSLAALVEKRRRLILELHVTTKRRAEAVAGKKGAPAIEAIGQEIDRLDVDRDRIEARIRSEHPRYAALMFPQPLNEAEVRRLLDPGTLLLEYFLGEDRSYVWALTPTGISGHELPPRREIEGAARRLKELLWKGKPGASETASAREARLTRATEDYWREASALSATLLGPVASQMKGKRLVVVADGELMYLPFGALPSPAAGVGTAPEAGMTPAPLIRDHVVVNLPSASVLSALRQTVRPAPLGKSVAVFADPVFEADDPRIQTARRGPATQGRTKRREELAQAVRDTGEAGDNASTLSRLPSTIHEARYILTSVPARRRLEATGFDAHREKATDPRLGQYSIVHFATHGILNEKSPELSGLVLSLYDRQGRFREDGFLSLSDIYGMSLPVDLVVLSACRSGLGKEVRGEGLIGLTRGFMYAGASRVVASLWQVDDEATAELMKLFYLKMFKEGMSPAEALRAAQVSLSGQKRWNSPYYWAGFVCKANGGRSVNTPGTARFPADPEQRRGAHLMLWTTLTNCSVGCTRTVTRQARSTRTSGAD